MGAGGLSGAARVLSISRRRDQGKVGVGGDTGGARTAESRGGISIGGISIGADCRVSKLYPQISQNLPSIASWGVVQSGQSSIPLDNDIGGGDGMFVEDDPEILVPQSEQKSASVD